MSTKRVEVERWRQAQSWELALWRAKASPGLLGRVKRLCLDLLRVPGLQQPANDDWNLWWAQHLEHYDFLPRDIPEYIELGCGPFTNTRIVLNGRAVGRAVCSDPLVRQYVALRRTWISRAHRDGLVMIDDHPIEECPYRDDQFDVVVMINVLDHVMDAELCLRNAIRINKPGGFLVIGQDLTSSEDAARIGEDIGHPIRLTLEDLDAHLAGHQSVLRKVLPRHEGRNPDAHYATLIYAGIKRPAPTHPVLGP